jgi:hypothetical protein
MFSLVRTSAALGMATLLFGRVAGAEEPQPIYGGNKVKPCGWPTTVSLGGCTGTLVHPELVIFAAHCMNGSYGPSTVTFADNENYPAFQVPTTSCKADPKYYSSSGRDVAYCRLAQPVTSVPIVPILMGCETQVLTAGASVTAVGFGQANDGLGWGPKREVTMMLNGISGGEAHIGGNGKDTCYGDSGGPVYVKLGDGTWRVFGITSYGEYCGGGGYYSMMHTAIDWLEQSSGLDLTPCHQQGQWAPSGDCGHFPLDPEVGGGSWSSGCATGNVSAMSATCGAPAGGGGSGAGGASGTGGSGFGGSGTGTGGASGSGGASSGGAGGFGNGAGVGGSGGSGSEGGSGQPPPPDTGCTSAPDCSACAHCVARCTCLTGDAAACVDACEPYGPPSASGGAGGGVQVDPGRAGDEPASEGCACRSAGSGRFGGSVVAMLAAIALASARRARSRREVTS